MADIIRIAIKTTSGYCCIDDAYTDKMILCKDSIRYRHLPVRENEANATRTWSYKSTNPVFQKLFTEACAVIEEILAREEESFVFDAGTITFRVTFADKTVKLREFFQTTDDFKVLYDIINQMVPECERNYDRFIY